MITLAISMCVLFPFLQNEGKRSEMQSLTKYALQSVAGRGLLLHRVLIVRDIANDSITGRVHFIYPLLSSLASTSSRAVTSRTTGRKCFKST